jgi:hypothetical protein
MEKPSEFALGLAGLLEPGARKLTSSWNCLCTMRLPILSAHTISFEDGDRRAAEDQA